MAHPATYKVLIGDRQIDLSIDGTTIAVDGSQKDLQIDRISAHTYAIIIDGKPYRVLLESVDGATCTMTVNGVQHTLAVQDERAQLLELYGIADSNSAMEKEVRAPMPGLVLEVLVAEGDEAAAGKGLLVLEAMKMENEIKAAADGTVARIHVKAGDPVAKGDLLLEFEG
ncbi:MAG: biotin/lipoyl-containing protein [Bacteroidota bacterium]